MNATDSRGDTCRDCGSVCGPSIKLQYNTRMFKARKRLNTRLSPRDTDENGSTSSYGLAPLVAVCQHRRSHNRRGTPDYSPAPPNPPPKHSPPLRHRQQRQRANNPVGTKADRTAVATKDERRAAASAAGAKPRLNRPVAEPPIDYMEVYQRLKLGRFFSRYAFPSFGACGSTSTSIPAGSDVGQPDRRRSDICGNGTADPVWRSVSAPNRLRNGLTTRLLRLLREREAVTVVGGGHEATISPKSSSPLLTAPPLEPKALPPLPKPRKSTTATTMSGGSVPTRQMLSASAIVCGPPSFASTALCSAVPFESTRLCHLAPALVMPSAVQSETAGLEHQRYRCADCCVLQRLSITGRLMGRRNGAAPCRWLGSSALLTRLRHPTHIELDGRVREVTVATVEFTLHRDFRLLPAATVVTSASTRFAFHAMSKRRSSSRSHHRGQYRYLYSLPVF